MPREETHNNLAFSTISALRFPLIVCVVLIHTPLAADNLSYQFFCRLVSFVTRAAVPAFFLFSGFLFFHEGAVFSWDLYIRKLQRRLTTLLIPYLFWNGLVLFRFYFTQHILGITDGNVLVVSEFTVSDWFRAFWDLYGGNPICFQFWFIRDLMVMALLSPLIFLLIRYNYVRWIFLSTVFLLWVLNVPCPTGLSAGSVFFFSLGALFSINGYDLIALVRRLLKPVLMILPVILLLDVFSWNGIFSELPLDKIGILLVIIAVVGVTSHMLEEGKMQINKELMDSTFFIYAAHPLLVAPLHFLIMKTLHPTLGIILISLYVGITALIIVVLFYVYRILKRWFPTLTAVITGGR